MSARSSSVASGIWLAIAMLGTPLAHASAQVAVIRGTVRGTNSVVLEGAVVTVTSSDSVRRTTTTNDQGKYVIVFSQGGTTFQLNVRATGYQPWSGPARFPVGATTATEDVVLRAGGSAADWPPAKAPTPALIYSRTDLGAADAVTITVDAGDIIVRGTSNDRVVYRTFPKVAPPTSADSPPPPGEIAPRGTHEIGADGLAIVAGSGVVLQIDVPRTLKRLKLTVTQAGQITVGNFDGELSILNASGSVGLGGIGGPTLVENRNGDITASIGTIPAAMNFLGRNGNITVQFTPEARANFLAEAHRGVITLDSTSQIVFPRSGGLDLSSIEDHRINIPPPDASTKLPWAVGGGGALISITTLNGNIIIRKNNPPKQEE